MKAMIVANIQIEEEVSGGTKLKLNKDDHWLVAEVSLPDLPAIGDPVYISNPCDVSLIYNNKVVARAWLPVKGKKGVLQPVICLVEKKPNDCDYDWEGVKVHAREEYHDIRFEEASKELKEILLQVFSRR